MRKNHLDHIPGPRLAWWMRRLCTEMDGGGFLKKVAVGCKGGWLVKQAKMSTHQGLDAVQNIHRWRVLLRVDSQDASWKAHGPSLGQDLLGQ